MDFYTSVNTNIQRYYDQLRAVKMALYADLSAQYKRSYDEETAKVLAAQIVNYLMAEDIEQIYINASEPLKSKIGQIKALVPELALAKLQKDSQVREAIVYTLRMEAVYKLGDLGEGYLSSEEKSRIDSILQKFEAEFPIEVTPSLYGLIVTRFLQDRSLKK